MIEKMTSNPVLVEIVRGDMVESRHRGAFVAVTASGQTTAAAGAIDVPIYARSSAKPLQALPLIETGAADAFGLGAKEIALACSSHDGAPFQIERVASWLSRLGLDEGALACGIQRPSSRAVLEPLYREGTEITALYNACSGKHTGFLTTARCLGEAAEGYIAADHPVQRRVSEAIGEMTGEVPSIMPHGVDGCGIPVLGASLRGWALALARLVSPAGLGASRAAAAARIVEAMRAHPDHVAGPKRACTLLMRRAEGRCLLKDGAEGVYVAGFPSLGLGAALKIDDGSPRAADAAMAGLLSRLGVLDGEAEGMKMRNWRGETIGEMRCAAAIAAG